MNVDSNFPKKIQPQHQDKQPGVETLMNPKPIYSAEGYSFPSGKLKDKVVIITGGDSGIGRAVSLAYAKEGAKVVCADVNEAGAKKSVAKIIELAGPDSAISFKVDVSKEDQVKALVDKAVDTYGNMTRQNIMYIPKDRERTNASKT